MDTPAPNSFSPSPTFVGQTNVSNNPWSLPLLPVSLSPIESQTRNSRTFWHKKWAKIILGIGIGCSLLILAVVAYHLFSKKDQIIVTDQVITSSFLIKKVTILHIGFVGIHWLNRLNNPGELIALSDFLVPDTYEDVIIPIDPQNTNGSLPEIASGTRMVAILYQDVDNNGHFTDKSDRPVKDRSGKIITAKFLAK